MRKPQNNIRLLRQEKQYTMEKLAELCNVGRTSISQYESGKRTPSNATQEALADIFNVDIDYLMGRTSIRRKVDSEGFITQQITSDEVNLINAYRKAPSETQQAIRLLLLKEKDYSTK